MTTHVIKNATFMEDDVKKFVVKMGFAVKEIFLLKRKIKTVLPSPSYQSQNIKTILYAYKNV